MSPAAIFTSDTWPRCSSDSPRQRYRGGGLKDIKTFTKKEGLTWQAGGGRTRTETELTAWIGKRGAAGRLPPHGFPKSNRFG